MLVVEWESGGNDCFFIKGYKLTRVSSTTRSSTVLYHLTNMAIDVDEIGIELFPLYSEKGGIHVTPSC